MSDVFALCLREGVMETTQGEQFVARPIRNVLALSVDCSTLRQLVSVISDIAR
jgi:hypothetical protein